MTVSHNVFWSTARAHAVEESTKTGSVETLMHDESASVVQDQSAAFEIQTLEVTVYQDASLRTPLRKAPKVTISGKFPAGVQAKAFPDDITKQIKNVDLSVASLVHEKELLQETEHAQSDASKSISDSSAAVTLVSLNLGLFNHQEEALDDDLLSGKVEIELDPIVLSENVDDEVTVYAATGDVQDVDRSDTDSNDNEAIEIAHEKISKSRQTVSFDIEEAGTYAIVRAARPPHPKNLSRNTPLNTNFSARDLGIQIDFFDYFGSNDSHFDSSKNVFESPDTSGINGDGHRFQFYGNGSPKGSKWPDNLLSINNYTAGDGVPLNNYQYDTSSVLQGIVQNKLGDDGFPVLAPGLRWESGTNARTTGNESLNYLFDASYQHGKSSYMDLDGFIQKGTINSIDQFTQDSQGSYYGYNSNQNYAYYDPNQGDAGHVDIFDDTYGKWNSHTNQFDANYKIGFFPFDKYAPKKNQVTPWDSKDSSKLNHHNGVVMSANFTLPPNGKVTNPDGSKSDMLFSFSGDDDVWVFVDGVLVLDMGGIHQPAQGTINFHTGHTSMGGDRVLGRPAYAESVDGAGITLGRESTIAQAFANAGKTFDSSPYSTHSIKFFYLERGGNDSNCMLAMNLAFTKTTELTVEKKWTDGDDLHTASDDSVYVQLYRQISGGNQEPVGEPVRLSKDSKDKYGIGPFRYTYDELPVRDELNYEVFYTVKEGTLVNGNFIPKEADIVASDQSYMLDKIEYQYAKGEGGSAPKVETYLPGDSSSYDAAFHNGNEDPQIGTAVITNRPNITIEVQKQWKDETGQHPDSASHDGDSVWVQLYKLTKQGDDFPSEEQALEVGTPIELNSHNGWKAKFNVVETGQSIKYFVREGSYDGMHFKPSDKIYAAKTTASDVGHLYERISTSYSVDLLEQKYKTITVPGSGSEPFSSSLDYGLHYKFVNGRLHRYIGTVVTGQRDSGLITPFGVKGGSSGNDPNNIYWSSRDLVPVRVVIPQDAVSFRVLGTVSGDDFNLYQEAGQIVRVQGVDSPNVFVSVNGNSFTVAFSDNYVKNHKGEKHTILVPCGVAMTWFNNGGSLGWINNRNRHAHINLQLSGTTGTSSISTQVVPDGDPKTSTSNSFDGGIQFVSEQQVADTPITKVTTLRGYAVIVNKPITASISLCKQDADTHELMNGVKFKLYSSDAQWTQGQQIAEQITKNVGTATFLGLSDGYYLLKEVKGSANASYVVPDGCWKVCIKNGEVTQFVDPSGIDVSPDSQGIYVLVNTKVKITLDILKKDGKKNTLLRGAHFTLKSDGITGEYVQADGSMGATAYDHKTDHNGSITIENLSAGVYWLTETKAPAGYQKLGKAIRIEISKDGSQAVFYEGSDQQKVTINNQTVAITVENSKAPDLPFAGATVWNWFIVGGCLIIASVCIAAFSRHRVTQ